MPLQRPCICIESTRLPRESELSQKRIREYEKEGLDQAGTGAPHQQPVIQRVRDHGRFSASASLIHERGFTVACLQNLLVLAPCWNIFDCEGRQSMPGLSKIPTSPAGRCSRKRPANPAGGPARVRGIPEPAPGQAQGAQPHRCLSRITCPYQQDKQQDTGPPLGVVLAGGPGRRIGGAKPFRTLAGRRLIDIALERLGRACSRLAVSGFDLAPFADLGVELVRDRWPGQGPLAAVATVFLETSAQPPL
jgi:hypothetical protein